MSSVPSRVNDRLLGFMAGSMAATPEPIVPRPPQSMLKNPFARSMYQVYNQYVQGPQTRLVEMKFYDFLHTEMPEVPKAMDAYTTMACTGTLTGTTRANFSIKINEKAPQALKDRLARLEHVINCECYEIIRSMAQYGSSPVELVLGPGPGDLLTVSDVVIQPPAIMFRNTDDTDGRRYWMRRHEGETAAEFLPRWKVPHFAIWSQVVTATKTRVYGSSMLQPVGRIALQVGSCIDALVVARLSRAAPRYKHTFDITDIAQDQDAVIARREMYRKDDERQRQVFGNRQDSYQRTPVPDGDFWVPGGKDLVYDVDVLEGDPNVGKIADIEFLESMYLGALGVPPQYLGHTGGGKASSMTQVDIQFARSARYLQMFAVTAFEHMVAVDMILGGFDPEDYEWSVVPPNIGARDELLSAQIRMLQSQVVANLFAAGLDPSENPRWVLEVLMNMGQDIQALSDETLAKLFKPPPPIDAGAGIAKPKAPKRPDRARSGAEALAEIARGTDVFVERIREMMAWDTGGSSARVLRFKATPTFEQLRRGIAAGAP